MPDNPEQSCKRRTLVVFSNHANFRASIEAYRPKTDHVTRLFKMEGRCIFETEKDKIHLAVARVISDVQGIWIDAWYDGDQLAGMALRDYLDQRAALLREIKTELVLKWSVRVPNFQLPAELMH